jgi:hypothetical protein
MEREHRGSEQSFIHATLMLRRGREDLGAVALDVSGQGIISKTKQVAIPGQTLETVCSEIIKNSISARVVWAIAEGPDRRLQARQESPRSDDNPANSSRPFPLHHVNTLARRFIAASRKVPLKLKEGMRAPLAPNLLLHKLLGAKCEGSPGRIKDERLSPIARSNLASRTTALQLRASELKQICLSRSIPCAMWALAMAVTAYAIISFDQLRTMRGQPRESQRPSYEFAAVRSAQITLEKVTASAILGQPHGFIVTGTIQNVGHTIAHEIRWTRREGLGAGRFPKENAFPTASFASWPDPTGPSLVAGQSMPFNFQVSLPEAVLNGNVWFLIHIYVSYRDDFDNDKVSAGCLLLEAGSRNFISCPHWSPY